MIEVAKNLGAFAKECPRGLNDLSIIIRSDVVLSSDKVEVKQ